MGQNSTIWGKNYEIRQTNYLLKGLTWPFLCKLNLISRSVERWGVKVAASVRGTHRSAIHGNGAVRQFKNKTLESKSIGPSEKFPFLSGESEEKLYDLAASASKISRRYLKIGRQYIKDHPIAGLAIATGVGFLAGSLFSMIVRRRI